PAPEPCELEDRPRCGPRAAYYLSLMLGGQHREVLPELLEWIAAAGQRVPEDLLPDLLDLGRSARDLRAAILPVLGKRGPWLAGQNPDWSYAVGAEELDEE